MEDHYCSEINLSNLKTKGKLGMKPIEEDENEGGMFPGPRVTLKSGSSF